MDAIYSIAYVEIITAFVTFSSRKEACSCPDFQFEGAIVNGVLTENSDQK